LLEFEPFISFFFLYKLVVCGCCWRNPSLWIDDRVSRMESTKISRDKVWIRAG
jgi:hypothetical protein